MGIYQYNTEQLKRLYSIYIEMPKVEEPDLDVPSFVSWLAEHNRKSLLVILRWEYGIYKGNAINECNDITYLQMRLRNAHEDTPYRQAVQSRITQLLEELQ